MGSSSQGGGRATAFGLSEAFRARIEVLGEIARGGMGVVLRARDRVDQRDLAIKLMLSGAEGDAARFQRESRALEAFRHPNVVRLWGSGYDGRKPYLLMELVEGEPLTFERFRGPGGAVDWRSATAVVAVIADALAACHSAGLVHRDIKPSNILIEKGSGRPVLVDFGLVKAHEKERAVLGASVALTRTGELLGTPAYMAPEQFCPGDFGEVGPPADVWGLAATLYTLLTGQRVYAEDDLISLVRALMKGEPARARSREPEIPAWLDEVLAACLRREPSRRLNIRELADALEGGEEAGALGRALQSSIDKGRRRRRSLRFGLAAGLALALVGSGLALSYRAEKREAQIAAALRAEASGVVAIERTLRDGPLAAAPALVRSIEQAERRLAAVPAHPSRRVELRFRLALARAVALLRGEAPGAAGAIDGLRSAAAALPREGRAARMASWAGALKPRPPSKSALEAIDRALDQARGEDVYFVLDLALARFRQQVLIGEVEGALASLQRDPLLERVAGDRIGRMMRERGGADLLAFLRGLRRVSGPPELQRSLALRSWRALRAGGGLDGAGAQDRARFLDLMAAEETRLIGGDIDVAVGLLELALTARGRRDQEGADRTADALVAVLEARPELGQPPDRLRAAVAAIERLFAVWTARVLAPAQLDRLREIARVRPLWGSPEAVPIERASALAAAAARLARAGELAALCIRLQAEHARFLGRVVDELELAVNDFNDPCLYHIGERGLALPLEALGEEGGELRWRFWRSKVEGAVTILRTPADAEDFEARVRDLNAGVASFDAPARRVALIRALQRSFISAGRSKEMLRRLPKFRERDLSEKKEVAVALIGRGQILIEFGRTREALAEVDRALALYPDLHEDASPLFFKAMAHLQLGEDAAAVGALRLAAREKSFSSLADWSLLVAAALAVEGRVGGALVDFAGRIRARALPSNDAVDPEHRAIVLELCDGLERLRARDYEASIKALRAMESRSRRLYGGSRSGIRSRHLQRIEKLIAAVERQRDRGKGFDPMTKVLELFAN